MLTAAVVHVRGCPRRGDPPTPGIPYCLLCGGTAPAQAEDTQQEAS